MTQVTITRMDTRDLWATFDEEPLRWYRSVAEDMQAHGADVSPTLSNAIEHVSPTQAGEGLDGFGRIMREAGIRTTTDMERGVYASMGERFFGTPGRRALFTEFSARVWRRTVGQRTILSGDMTPGSFQRPYTESAGARWNQEVRPAIPLSELVALVTPISGQDYRSLYLTYDATQLRMFRVGESADIPVATIATSEHIIRARKYGRGVRISYEDMRRSRVDRLAFLITQMAVQAEVDKVAAALDVIVNGDGNSGTTPTTHNLTALDAAAAAGTLTLKGWLNFKMQFLNPYVLTHALMTQATALQLAMLNTGSANVPLSGANLAGLGLGLTPINQFADGVRYGWTADAPALKIVGYDRRYALEHVIEIGSEIAEMERFILNQTQVLTMSEVSGFAVMNGGYATRILDVNA